MYKGVPCFIELYPEGLLCGERIDLFIVESQEVWESISDGSISWLGRVPFTPLTLTIPPSVASITERRTQVWVLQHKETCWLWSGLLFWAPNFPAQCGELVWPYWDGLDRVSIFTGLTVPAISRGPGCPNLSNECWMLTHDDDAMVLACM